MLRRSSADEKLGLTLCYETDNTDGFTDIFIDDIHPDGLAKKDGRLRLGDQIVQVYFNKVQNIKYVQHVRHIFYREYNSKSIDHLNF